MQNIALYKLKTCILSTAQDMKLVNVCPYCMLMENKNGNLPLECGLERLYEMEMNGINFDNLDIINTMMQTLKSINLF